jgi:hypothetical protein
VSTATGLRRGEQVAQLRGRLAVFETIGDDAQRECLDVRQCRVARQTTRDYARQLADFSDPKPISFLFELDAQRADAHGGKRNSCLDCVMRCA